MPRGDQEGRRAAVALHAGDVEPGLRVPQLRLAMRADSAAGVQVRVDQRCERGRRLDRGVQAETHLAQEGEVGAETGGHDQAVRPHYRHPTPLPPGDGQRAICLRDAVDEERREGGDGARLHQRLGAGAEFAPTCQPVRRTAAEAHAGQRAPEGPEHAGAGRGPRQLDEVEHGVHRRVPGPDDERRPPGVPGVVRPERVGRHGGEQRVVHDLHEPDQPGQEPGRGHAGPEQRGRRQRHRPPPRAGRSPPAAGRHAARRGRARRCWRLLRAARGASFRSSPCNVLAAVAR